MSPPDAPDVCVIGAGVAGLAAAVQLRIAGRRVLVFDPAPPGSETSSGNAGLLSPDTAIPIAMPGMLRRVPRMLADPNGPLTLRWRGLPRLTPWLVRWMFAARPATVDRVSDAMRALHRDTFSGWRELLGAERFDMLIRKSGQLRVWEGDAGLSREELRLYERHRIDIEAVDGARLHALAPGLAGSFRHGLLVRGNGYAIDPHGVVKALAERFLQLGGSVRREAVLRIRPVPRGAGWLMTTSAGDTAAATVVVAAGLWSCGLLRPLGLRVPLESERGYNATLAGEHLGLQLPVVFVQEGFVVTPMQQGTRAAGTVELGAHPGAPDLRRAERLLAMSRRAFPALRGSAASLWSGDRPSTPDGLPLLGALRGRPGLFLCTGHGHFGLTAAPRSAQRADPRASAGSGPCPGRGRRRLCARSIHANEQNRLVFLRPQCPRRKGDPMIQKSVTALIQSAVVAGLLVSTTPSSAQGQPAGYPRQTVTITVAYAAGGATDITTRVIAQELTKLWGHSVVVENRPGAGGNIGAAMIARAKPDGYNLIMVAPAHTVNATLYPNPGYEPIKDFEPIAQVTNMTNMVVAHPSFPAKNIQELIEMAKKPDGVVYASGGTGTSEHMAAELFQYKTGVKMTHIPYKGTGQVIPDLLSGQVKLTFGNMPALLQHIQKGSLKPLAVSTAKRSSVLPDVATVAESGVPGFEVIVWLGLLAPAGTPADIVQKINTDVAAVLKLPAVRERFAAMGMEPTHSTPAEFRKLLETEIDKYATVIKAAKLRIE